MTVFMIREWNLLETNLDRIRRRRYEVAVIPTGATEAHNLHLPEGTDVYCATAVAQRACELAWPRCESVICLPAIPYGVDSNLHSFPLSLHVSQDTLNAMLRDIFASLVHFGIRKIVIVNGHGGNDFTAFVRQIQCDLKAHVFACNWWTVGNDRYGEIFEKQEDHAGELETSTILSLSPGLVEMDRAKDGHQRPFRFEALRRGWVRTSRDFGRTNDHCASGEPFAATPEKGKQYLDLVCDRVGNFLVELAVTPIDEFFPHTKEF